MDRIRRIKSTWRSQPTSEGAGVRLKRVFGNAEVPRLDPFLLLDDFHSDRPEDYLAGFPWHPHRGIETVTYMLEGEVEHQDSMGNKGVVKAGDIQWMTAGSGIIHSEMPKQKEGLLWGMQLWLNLPRTHKMMAPRYQDIPADKIPTAVMDGDVKVRVVCGKIAGKRGPVEGLLAEPEFLDITMPEKALFKHHLPPGHRLFAYVLEGQGEFESGLDPIGAEHLILFSDGEEVHLQTRESSLRTLLISGKPLGEPLVWGGPIVMNTEAELRQAFMEYQQGTFIKKP